MDSQLDLARAYLDMGDDESARPVLTLVIEQGSLTQQAEARALLNRLDVS
jgi:pilus assembly protein FimV